MVWSEMIFQDTDDKDRLGFQVVLVGCILNELDCTIYIYKLRHPPSAQPPAQSSSSPLIHC